MTRLIRALATAGLLGGWLAGASPAAGGAAPAATPPARLVIQADEVRIDAAAQVATAIGRVRITDGTTTATGARAVLHHKEGRGVLTGEARVVGPQGILEGDQITVAYTHAAITRIHARGSASLEAEAALVTAHQVTVRPAADTVTAERAVTLFVKPDIVATAARLVFARTRGTVVLEGRARVQTAEGFVEGDRVEGDRRLNRAVVTGDVHATFRDVEVRSRTADLDVQEKRAVFAGDVRVVQPGRKMTTERVTVWYAAGRMVAEGQTSIRLEPPP